MAEDVLFPNMKVKNVAIGPTFFFHRLTSVARLFFVPICTLNFNGHVLALFRAELFEQV